MDNEGGTPDDEQGVGMGDGVSSVSSENDARSNIFKYALFSESPIDR